MLIYFANFCPHDYHNNFWQELADKFEQKEFIIIRSVADECKYPYQLVEWIKKLKNKKLIKPLEDDVINRAQAINKEFKMITKYQGKYKSIADTQLIAYAEIHKLPVLSYESKRRKNQPNKIPDVCEALEIDYKRYPIDVMKEMSFNKCS